MTMKNESRTVYHGVALLGTRIYVVGGCTTGDTYLRTVDGFDTVTGDWEHCDSMHVARAFLSVAVLDGHLYAIGGHTGKLYVSGGNSGGDVLSSVEEYTAELDSWVLVMSMPSPRSNHRMVVHDDSIYVIGGYNGRRRLDLVLKNVGNVVREWEDVAPLSVSRSSFTVVDFRGEIYVIGGVTDGGLTAVVEQYSSVSNTWRSLVAPLGQPLGAMDACVVVGLAAARRLSGR
ncbi:kelch-like protein 40 [Dermacentor variabilis]|uniref:kelch-like protein 40 n=1 Tax=Dermacentor variabilis TaxID=34621 RepID=UPI003F5C0BDA